MGRTKRLLKTVELLRRPRVTKAVELAHLFGISQRTVYRDINDLVKAGIPIRGEAGVGYHLQDHQKKRYRPSAQSRVAQDTRLSLGTMIPYIEQSKVMNSRLKPMQIPIAKPWFDEADYTAIRHPLETGWVVQGPKVGAFEKAICQFTGATDAIACTSGTSALHLCTMALGLGPGDEVIVPSFTFVACANAVAYTQATPVLVDIDIDTYNIDLGAIEAAITPRTRAIMVVHLFGQSAPMKPILELAHRHNLDIIEDSACALGTTYGEHEQHVGTFGKLGIFSFHPRKVICTGEGGIVITSDESIATNLRSLRSHGVATPVVKADTDVPAFLLGDFDRLGFNYRMTDMQGALGCTQMEKLPTILDKRRQFAARYDRLLENVSWLRTPAVLPNSAHSYQAYVCLYAPESPSLDNWQQFHDERNTLMNYAEKCGVATRQGTQAVHALSLYRDQFNFRPEDLPNAWFAEKLTIALPLYPQMTEAEQDYVVKTLIEGAKNRS
jgi:perosamine synthetase